jgi:hypothetical protein
MAAEHAGNKQSNQSQALGQGGMLQNKYII